MSDSIRLSEKHGLNPSIPICFWCMEEKNEIALLGKMKDDAEAPRHVVVSYEPCEKCKKAMEQGITLIGVTEQGAPNQPSMFEDTNIYPSGDWMIVKEESEFFQRMIETIPEEEKENILKTKKCLMHKEDILEIIEFSEQQEENNEEE